MKFAPRQHVSGGIRAGATVVAAAASSTQRTDAAADKPGNQAAAGT